MDLETVLLKDNVQYLQRELEKTRKELEKTKRLEKILRSQVDHLLRHAYSEDNGLAEKQKEINRLQKRNRELVLQIQAIQQKTTKLRL